MYTSVQCNMYTYTSVLEYFRKPLILCVEKQLIGEHLEEILDKGTCTYCIVFTFNTRFVYVHVLANDFWVVFRI